MPAKSRHNSTQSVADTWARKLKQTPYPDERTLVEACLESDERAWDVLQKFYAALIYSVIAAPQWKFSRQEVDDLCADVFLKLLHNGLKKFKYQSSLGHYLVTITRNLCIQVKRNRRERFMSGTLSLDQELSHDRVLEQVLASDEDVAAQVLHNEAMKELKEAMKRLDEEAQMILRLRFGQRMKYEDMANFMSIPCGSVGGKITQSLQKLMDAWTGAAKIHGRDKR